MPFIVTAGQLNRRAQLYHQLGAMIESGVPIMKALDMASRNPEVRSSKKTVSDLMQAMQSGLNFTDSMTRVHGWIPEFDAALLSVGEQAGRLDQSFKTLAGFYEARAKIIHDTIADLITTIATLHVFLLVFPLGYLQSFARGIFLSDYALCVPFLIQKALVFGSLYGIVLFLIFACQGNRGEGWRSIVESILRPIPILGTARKYLALSRLAAALGATTRSGVSIVSGWELASVAGGSPRLRRTVSNWEPHIKSGSTHGELINKDHYFPEMFGNFYFTGEQSGRLDDALEKLENYYHDEGFRKLRTFTRVMNGTIYGLIVLMVAYSVIHFYTGYYGNMLNQFN